MSTVLKAIYLFLFGATLISGGATILAAMHDRAEKQDYQAEAYAILYNCTKVGFSGNNEPFYACDTGVVTRSQMATLAEQGDSNAQR